MRDDEWRVEIDLDDAEHGLGLGERLRAHDLDDEARKRLGGRVVVTRDGPRVFLYAGRESESREAERVARELVATENLTAEIAVTRWHPVEEAWKDASIPLPQTAEGEHEELRLKEETKWIEAQRDGSYDWLVKIALPGRAEAAEVQERLDGEGFPVHRRWRYVTVDVLTQELADELAERLRDELPDEAEIWVDASPNDIPNPAFVLLESRL
ncbi:MAG TPA: hypothetical protein VK488_00205 [Gaiellaceae bacterium]|nr:hypothetical protein [Gaiellaceae bacterium]